LEFRVGDAESLGLEETFDCIVWSDLLGDLLDIQQALECIRSACDARTRLIFHYHSVFWEPIVKLAQALGRKAPQLNHNWMSRHDIENLLILSDFEMVSRERKILLPIGIPIVSALCNRWLAVLPGFRSLCLVNVIVARKKARPRPAAYSVSVIVPCRNEKGTIRAAVERLPLFGESQEIIFVDGHSTDGTWEEIEKVKAEFPHRDIRSFRQAGKGKGDAVRLGFDAAAKDILMILDSDLAVPPEDMPKFYHALAAHKAEFVNGSRLVYPMEAQAMRFLNILGNQFFSVALTWLLNQPLKDTLCGTKALFSKDYAKIKAGRAYFGDFDPFGDFDLLFGAVRQNLKILEIPVRYRERTYGVTNISRFRHGFLLMKMVCFGFFKLKW
jgi:Glycosyl transferase family 2